MSIFNKQFMQFSPVPQNSQHQSPYINSKHPDDCIAVYLDMFFNYIKRKINVFDPTYELDTDMRFGLSKQDQRLAQLSFIRV